MIHGRVMLDAGAAFHRSCFHGRARFPSNYITKAFPGMNSRPKSLYSANAALASGHHLASLAAKDCLDAGGSLMDATIAASAVLTVVLPHATSLGGCGMLLYYDASTGCVHVLNGTGRAPLDASPALFENGMPQRGARAAVVPTLVRLWARAHERFGRRDWKQILAPAIALAERGIATPEELARNLRNVKPEDTRQPGFGRIFQPGGHTLTAGDTFRQANVARVLQKIARDGEDGFYRGEVAHALVRFSRAHDGLFKPEDFESASADWAMPWSSCVADTVVHVAPPNSTGVLMLRLLDIWGAARHAGEEPGMAVDVENAMAAIAQGRNLIGDPLRTVQTPEQFGLGASMKPGADHAALKKSRLDIGDTSGFVAMDRDGNAVSLLQSVFQPFGSCAVEEETGILLNNRMYDFEARPGLVNSIGSGVRPSHTLNPWLMTSGDGRACCMAGASPGGVSQTTTGFQLITGALSSTSTLGSLVSGPRWSLSRDGAVLLEPGIAGEVAEQLRQHGHTVIENSNHEFYFGSAKLVRRSGSGWLEVAADMRRQAFALAW